MFEIYNNFKEFIIIFSKDGKLKFANNTALYYLNSYLSSILGLDISEFISEDNVEYIYGNIGDSNEITMNLDFTLGFSAECEIKFIEPDYDVKCILVRAANSEGLLTVSGTDKIYDPLEMDKAGIYSYNTAKDISIAMDYIDELLKNEIIKNDDNLLEAVKAIGLAYANMDGYYKSVIKKLANSSEYKVATVKPVNPVTLAHKVTEQINGYFSLEGIPARIKVASECNDCVVLLNYEAAAKIFTGVVSIISACAADSCEIDIDFETDDNTIRIKISEKSNSYSDLCEMLKNPEKEFEENPKWIKHGIKSKYSKIVEFMFVNNGKVSFEQLEDGKGICFTLEFEIITDRLLQEMAEFDEKEMLKKAVEEFFVNINI